MKSKSVFFIGRDRAFRFERVNKAQRFFSQSTKAHGQLEVAQLPYLFAIQIDARLVDVVVANLELFVEETDRAGDAVQTAHQLFFVKIANQTGQWTNRLGD